MRKRVRLTIAVLLLTSLLASCGQKETYEGLKLPATPVLTIQTYWAVVDFAYLRVRSEPDNASELITMLRTGTIIEILSSTANEETIEGKTGRWYQVQYQGRRGWVFGPYIKIFDSIEKARNAAKAGVK